VLLLPLNHPLSRLRTKRKEEGDGWNQEAGKEEVVEV
jgi:hypothetical protein